MPLFFLWNLPLAHVFLLSQHSTSSCCQLNNNMLQFLKSKFFISLLLFITFFSVFGISTIRKFLKEDIVTVTSSSPRPEGLPLPAITVCSFGPSGRGAKSYEQTRICLGKDNLEELLLCVRKNSFNLHETIIRTIQLDLIKNEMMELNSTYWKSDIYSSTRSNPENCHTLEYPESVTNMDMLRIDLTKGQQVRSHKVFVYDPSFFVKKLDSFFVPFLFLADPNGKSYRIVTTYRTRMNRPPEFSCNMDHSHSFTECVANSLATKIGCVFPRQGQQIPDIPLPTCNTSGDLLHLWDEHYKLYLADQPSLTKLTGCLVPCHYHQYSIVGTPDKYEIADMTYMTLSFASTTMTTSQEQPLYPLDSLVSEFGGALGLFLGFSFLGFTETIKSCCRLLQVDSTVQISFYSLMTLCCNHYFVSKNNVCDVICCHHVVLKCPLKAHGFFY